MNPLAKELNDRLTGTVASRLLSRIGMEMYFPKGIVAQTAEANARAHRYNATVGMAFAGGEPIMLGAVAELVSGLRSRDVVAYAPTPGVPDLRDVWKRDMIRKNPGLEGVATSRPLVTAGLTNGLFQLAELFADPGDALVVPELFWGNYRLMFETRRGATIATYPLFGDNGGFNVEALSNALKDKSKAIVLLNFPNNPTGYSPTKDEADRIVEALVSAADFGVDILTIFDDAYFGLFYEEGLLTESLFGACAVAHDRILAAKVDGATKEDFAWGFRVGFLTYAGRGMNEDALKALETKTMGNIRATISNSSRIAQSVLTAVHDLPGFEAEKAEQKVVLEKRYRRVREIVRDAPRELLPLPFNSGYFMAFECRGLSAEDLRLALLDRGIGTIAIGTRYLRVAYSTVDIDDLDGLYSEVFETASSLAG